MADLLSRLTEGLRDRYQVEREVGRGGMATVYLATDLKHNRRVAIKVLSPDLAASVGHERFLREIAIAAKLQHPHILPVYDSGEADGLLFYVMPFVDGESLRDRLHRDGPLPADDALHIAEEVAGALDFAHRQGIVHRDIKPANILISDGHAVVADFGIARALSVSGGVGLTQVGTAIGTPSYMSPEQALGEQEVDGRTDIYALGCVLYEMSAGDPPYEGTTPQAILAKAISGKVPRLAKDRAGVQGTIERAMAREPADRFQTAAEFRTAVRSGASGPRPAARPFRRGVLVPAIAVAAVALAAFLTLRPHGYRVAGDPRQSLIVFPFENRTADPDKDYLSEASMNLLGLAIAHWADMRVYDDERTGSLMRRRGTERAEDIDFDAAQAMARDAQVGTLVLGDIRREGDSLTVEAKVHDVRSGNRIATEIVRTTFDADPRPLFDSLAARILQVSGAPPGERPALVAQTTRSLEAYRAYLRGVAALQVFEIDSARANLLRAVELDSTFALAYLRLRDVEGWSGIDGSPERRREWVAKAQRWAQTLPPRLRTLLQFHVAYEAGELGRARGQVERLIARDSTDVEAWYQLGEAHFHDRAMQVPHADSAGNLGKALRAFQRSLAIDSGYVLAYQHIVDALGSCALNNPWLCLADSAVYGTQETLTARYGSDRVQQLRNDASTERMAAAHAWVNAVPTSTRARHNLINLLLLDDRREEARTEIAALRENGDRTAARIWSARILLRDQAYAAAADTLTAALENSGEAFRLLLSGNDGPAEAFSILASGGRLARTRQLADEMWGAVASSGVETGNGPGNVPMPVSTLLKMMRIGTSVEIGIDSAAIRSGLAGFLTSIDSLFADAPDRHQRVITAMGAFVLASYLVTQDTTALARFLAQTDTANSITWRTVRATLQLRRGDTAAAARSLERYALSPSPGELTGEPGAVRTMGWAAIATELGRLRDAIDLYATLDSGTQQLQHPTLHVRSLAERAALYQRLGDTTHAIEMYEGFIAAWERADESLQPLVERARAALAGLRGQPYPPIER